MEFHLKIAMKNKDFPPNFTFIKSHVEKHALFEQSA